MAEATLTDEERRAIVSLKRLAKKWPDTLWLFATGSDLNVMRVKRDGRRAYFDGPRGGPDPDYCVDTIHGIPNDGGDW